eukprot:3688191-Pyramimonas_sp.AAC.1
MTKQIAQHFFLSARCARSSVKALPRRSTQSGRLTAPRPPSRRGSWRSHSRALPLHNSRR